MPWSLGSIARIGQVTLYDAKEDNEVMRRESMKRNLGEDQKEINGRSERVAIEKRFVA